MQCDGTLQNSGILYRKMKRTLEEVVKLRRKDRDPKCSVMGHYKTVAHTNQCSITPDQLIFCVVIF
jgi:hypothetical protein